ncbi:hypothetical protein QQS21_010995 [Conoideocrella luteorostrata]|uniref:Major facilitator superfamily (MFS) profile domain-containing protein n=1 Tax=Conoideocrella luteorostrata TaxID=1105319 RepID=A0AAJ0FNT7_9HYPO|nr:hypothetical protein QQS21_010995 [Conoideocrella luteorostrata]
MPASQTADTLTITPEGGQPAASDAIPPQETVSEKSPQEESPRSVHGIKWFLVVVSLLASFLLYALDTTIVATIQPAIIATFGHVDLVPWLGVSFALASAASTLIWSKAYGVFSAKKLFLGSTALFMGASGLCGGAPHINAFVVGRALAGVGGTGMYMGLLTILSVSTSDAERPRYLSLTGFWWGIGTVLGPVVGGAFAQSPATWRWSFYLNPCVGGVVAPIYFIVLPDYHPLNGIPLRRRLAMLDYIGALLSSATFLCVMMAMNFGGVLWRWNDGRSVALFVLAGVFWVLFCLQQVYTVGTSMDHRIFPMHFFKNYAMVNLFITMNTADEQTSNAKIYGYTILLGVGVGCYCQAGFPAAQVQVAAKDFAYSVGFMTVSQMLGIALGTGISGAVFVNLAHQGLEHLFPNATTGQISSAVAGVGSDLLNSASPETATAAIHAIAAAIQNAFVPVFVTGAAAFLCSLAMMRQKGV